MILQFLPLLFDAPLAFTIICSAFVISMLSGLIFHEFCHALVADRLGDRLPRRMGRLTLDPRAHYDPIGTTLIFFVGFGWAKPVPVNPRNASQMAIIALAGPLSNFVIAGLAALPMKIGLIPFWHPFVGGGAVRLFATQWAGSPEDLIGLFLGTVVLLNVLLGTFNLIPIPPLDGSRLLDLVLSPKLAHEWQRWGPGMLMLLILAPYITGGAFSMLTVTGPFVDLLLRVFLGDATTIRFS
ncbi:MAG: site-2 protease family protein [Dehalococcoidia bacterium]|nr:MAG: site-2 protease family protein [Dehalococcoidia bacterium]